MSGSLLKSFPPDIDAQFKASEVTVSEDISLEI
jgi:hypothetical protein